MKLGVTVVVVSIPRSVKKYITFQRRHSEKSPNDRKQKKIKRKTATFIYYRHRSEKY